MGGGPTSKCSVLTQSDPNPGSHDRPQDGSQGLFLPPKDSSVPCPRSLSLSLPLPSPVTSSSSWQDRVWVLTCFCFCLSGSLLAYNTPSHTDQSPRLSVKEGKSIVPSGTRIVSVPAGHGSMLLRWVGVSGLCPALWLHTAFSRPGDKMPELTLLVPLVGKKNTTRF